MARRPAPVAAPGGVQRVRDKVAASKRKGMWMGGNIPLGYDIADRKLVVNEAEAATVRLIYDRYLALGSIGDLAAELDLAGIRSKRRELNDGRVFGERRFSPGALAHLLKNRTYVGEVSHHGQHYPGEHQAIIDPALFDRVQARIAANTLGHRTRARARTPSLLASILRDSEGRAMRPSHATKGSRCYRYYVTASTTADRRTPASACTVPAGELDQLVRDRVAAWLGDARSVLEIAGDQLAAGALPELITAAAALAAELAELPVAGLRHRLLELGTSVQVDHDQVLVGLSASALQVALGMPSDAHNERRCVIAIPAALTRRGQELRLAFSPNDDRAPTRVDVKLVGLIAKGHAALRQLPEGAQVPKTARDHLTRLARLAMLAPDITSAILDGRQPASLSARALLRLPELPLAWDQQRRALGFT